MNKQLEKQNTYAFIDGQNLHLGIQALDWILDYKRFRIYLKEKYGIEKAFLFIGHLKENEFLYTHLRACGFILMFKETSKDARGRIKGNVDVDLTLHTVIKLSQYTQAVLVTSDGDFAPLVEHLQRKSKLYRILSPNHNACSWLLRKYAGSKVDYLNNAKEKLKKHP